MISGVYLHVLLLSKYRTMVVMPVYLSRCRVRAFEWLMMGMVYLHVLLLSKFRTVVVVRRMETCGGV